MLTMSPGTRSKLEYTSRLLSAEFAQLPREDVVRELEVVSDALFAGAHFDDYIPILAHRFARERLLVHRPARVMEASAA